jgi:hypothetical protein
VLPGVREYRVKMQNVFGHLLKSMAQNRQFPAVQK